jgi:hypothetical protein
MIGSNVQKNDLYAVLCIWQFYQEIEEFSECTNKSSDEAALILECS